MLHAMQTIHPRARMAHRFRHATNLPRCVQALPSLLVTFAGLASLIPNIVHRGRVELGTCVRSGALFHIYRKRRGECAHAAS